MRRVYCAPQASARHHMEEDRQRLLTNDGIPSARIYDFTAPAITAGLFSEPEKVLRLSECASLGLDIVKRPTGGGILFHNTDIVCSFVLPCTGTIPPLCQQMNDLLLKALAPFLPSAITPEIVQDSTNSFCMARAAPLDLLWNGKKIGGGAQRKRKDVLLHQVSIFISSPDWEKIQRSLQHPENLEAMKTTSCSLEELSDVAILREKVREAIITFLQQGFFYDSP